MVSSEWQEVFGGQCSCTAEKFSAHQEMRPPDFRRMNSALKKFHHQPLAKASGMKFGLVAQQSSSWYWLHFTRMHFACTLARKLDEANGMMRPKLCLKSDETKQKR
jgi:hypothetical protein